ncbi:hypothetical protein [Nitrincola iocasae]|uniref:Uncharacterized protein n=1 Tax=Nitrincola iocasae TaxID=2614693 RepID=A0A5J6LAW5_9GAMM|nr:hypothetical protein [Nitrincola iocasae]QEW05630.1 hypothetical protein F5I99_03520 [Nitrincola iocasae]
MNAEIQALKQQVAELQQQLSLMDIQVEVNRSLFVALTRYFAEGNQLYIPELCDDLDQLCLVRSDQKWQTALIATAEILRALDESLPKQE